jgi:hypothetical protein
LHIYKRETNEIVTNDNRGLKGDLLKLCTFKVVKNGYKIGELLLKQAFNFAIINKLDHIYVTVDPSDHDLLRALFIDFGFYSFGIDSKGRDEIFVKDFPKKPPLSTLLPLPYVIKYFPMVKIDNNSIYLVPIKPKYHKILFPELKNQFELFSENINSAGNAIKQAYLCKSPNKSIKPGDILFFYRTEDEKAITSYGIVEQFQIESNAEQIFQWVAKRTVYSFDEIATMAGSNVKVILFRLIAHLEDPVPFKRLKELKTITGPIQSIISVSKDKAIKIIEEVGLNDRFISN